MDKTEVDALWDEYERKHLVPQAYAKLDHYLRNNLDDVDYAEYSQALDVVLSASETSAPGLSDEVDRQNAGFDRCFEALGFSSDHGFERSWSSLVLEIQRALTRASAATVDEASDWTVNECVATGQTCTYGPHGRHGEMQCKYCGAKPAAQQQAEPGADERAASHIGTLEIGSDGEYNFRPNREEIQRVKPAFGDPSEKHRLYRAAQSGQRAGVADGWKLVPKEPTDDMIRHLVAELQGECVNIFRPEGWWEDIRSALRDAIAAA